MAPPLIASHRAWRLLVTFLIGMVRVIGRTNGESSPAVMLSVNTTEDPVEARRRLVNEAAKHLKPESTCTLTEDVQIFLTGGVPVNIELLEKDDEIYFAFDGAGPTRSPSRACGSARPDAHTVGFIFLYLLGI